MAITNTGGRIPGRREELTNAYRTMTAPVSQSMAPQAEGNPYDRAPQTNTGGGGGGFWGGMGGGGMGQEPGTGGRPSQDRFYQPAPIGTEAPPQPQAQERFQKPQPFTQPTPQPAPPPQQVPPQAQVTPPAAGSPGTPPPGSHLPFYQQYLQARQRWIESRQNLPPGSVVTAVEFPPPEAWGANQGWGQNRNGDWFDPQGNQIGSTSSGTGAPGAPGVPSGPLPTGGSTSSGGWDPAQRPPAAAGQQQPMAFPEAWKTNPPEMMDRGPQGLAYLQWLNTQQQPVRPQAETYVPPQPTTPVPYNPNLPGGTQGQRPNGLGGPVLEDGDLAPQDTGGVTLARSRRQEELMARVAKQKAQLARSKGLAFAFGTDNSAQYQANGMGNAWIPSSTNSYTQGRQLPPAIQRLVDMGMPIPPALLESVTGGENGPLNMARAFTARGGGSLPSLQGLDRMSTDERGAFSGYLSGPIGMPETSTLDSIGRPTQNLQRAQTSRMA